jgi:hypothetical protein
MDSELQAELYRLALELADARLRVIACGTVDEPLVDKSGDRAVESKGPCSVVELGGDVKDGGGGVVDLGLGGGSWPRSTLLKLEEKRA